MQDVRRLPEIAVPERRAIARSDVLVGVLLVLVLVVGGYFRFVGLNWDDFTHLHPDERFLTDVAQGLGNQLNPSGDASAAATQVKICAQRYPATAGMGTYFDTYCSALNPLNANSAHGLYVYGTLPLFMAKAAGDLVVQGADVIAHSILANSDPKYLNYDGSQWATYDGIQLVWRFLSVLAEMAVIFLCFLIGRKLHDKWVGLLAAYLYAVTVFSIQMAHFGTVDAIANLFSALAIYFAVLAQRDGKLYQYALFGIAFGCAVSSRINMVPLAALIALAGLLQILPAFETQLAPGERTRVILYHGGGLVLAAFLSLLCFRIFNPYAFNGPGFFGLSLNGRWLDNMSTAQALNAGAPGYDSPPNFQWVGRTPYLYPWQNMVLWGMGAPLGLIGWIAWLWAGYRMVRGKRGALNNALLFAWVLIYFGWLGRNWVTTMRYFLPIYPVLIVLAAWALVGLIRHLREFLWRRRIAVALLCLVGVFSLLWSAMFTNIYRHLLTRVQATYYVWEHVPGDFAMTVDDPAQASPVVKLAMDDPGGQHVYDSAHSATTQTFTAPVTGRISAVYADYLDDAGTSSKPALFDVTITRTSDQQVMSEAYFGRDLTHTVDKSTYSYTIPFTPFTAEAGAQYGLNLQLVDGGPITSGTFSIPIQVETVTATPLINIGLQNNTFGGGTQDDLVSRVTRFDALNRSMTMTFTAPASGTVTSIYAPHLGDPNDDAAPELMRFAISKPGGFPLTTATLNTNLGRDAQNILGHSYDIPLDQPLTVEKGEQYDFTVELDSNSTVISGGSVFTWEGAWDDPVPYTVCALPNGLTLEDNPPSGLYSDARDCTRLDGWAGLVNGYEQNMVYEDDPSKRDHLLMTLDNSDYLVISSNRFYDPMSRNPMRWPMTNFYYKELFAGKLGYDLEATFQETFQLGPLKISDQYLPTYTAPQWLNEFESEEAFSVYDHPVVFIFHKRDDYNQQQVHDLLDSVSLTRIADSSVFSNCVGIYNMPCDTTLYNVDTLSSSDAAIAPTNLQFPAEMRATQFDNGTWSQRFDENSIVNTNQVIGVIVWWMTILLFGFAAYPLLFMLLPGLADRGYAFAKFAGMLVTGWATWYLASARIPVWSQAGIAGALVVLFVIGMALMWRKRDEFVTYLREHWRLLFGIEIITLIAFLVFVGVRLTNPDLWHPIFGGEKPMDFAFFNGVLRSTVFPPIDPWFSGGFINYYYFGFVIVGAPVLLLKMFPSFAYNLILPTLFALAGIAAFSVAYSLVNTLRERRASENGAGTLRRLGNPWVAGIMALLLAVFMGNLDTPRVFLTGIAQAGGYVQPQGIQSYLISQYTQEHGAGPDDAAMQQISAEAASPSLSDQISYEANNSVVLVSSLVSGFGKLLSGQNIGIGAERWFWGPTRILAETPGVEGNAINEMPAFTFVYGDMHAHMIAMPMQLAVMALILNEVLLAGNERRRRWIVVGATALLGLYVGMMRATNTWDWITFMLLSVVGLGFAWWVAQPVRSFWGHFTRRSLLKLAGYAGGFVVFSFLAALPYTTWYVTTYNRVLPWTDGKTPLWAYFDIHGLFLFLIVSLLVWETTRWLRSMYVRSLRGMWSLLVGALLILVALLLASALLALESYQVTLVVLPLLAWIAILFFRSGQSRVMQFVLLLAGLGLGLTLGVEYVVLDGDIGRQNTVFKFYIQAWLLFSVVGGVAFAWLISSYARWRSVLSNVWMFVLVLLVGTASLFPIMATRGKATFRFDETQPLTLNGMDYMNYGSQYEGDDQLMKDNPDLAPFPLSEDYAMIRWMQQNVQGSPVIVEGLSEASLYKWNGRISIYTGLPAVAAWNWHEKQQRTVAPLGQLVDARIANVNAFYETTNIQSAWQILQYYDVGYVVVGRLEQSYYNASGLAKFDQMVRQGLLTPVFHTGNSTIYQVNKSAALTIQG